MFDCLGFYVRLENFSPIWRRPHYQWTASNLELYSALVAIEQWGFFSVPHLLWHEASVYIGHLWDPVTPTPVAERFEVELSLYIPFLRLRCVAAGIWTLKHNYFANKLLQVNINKLNSHICIAYIRIRHLYVCPPPYGLCTKYLIEFSNSFPDKFNWLLVHSETWSSSTWRTIISFLMARFFFLFLLSLK